MLNGIESSEVEIDLPTPLVDSKLNFEAIVDDTYNAVHQPINIYVSGIHQFDS